MIVDNFSKRPDQLPQGQAGERGRPNESSRPKEQPWKFGPASGTSFDVAPDGREEHRIVDMKAARTTDKPKRSLPEEIAFTLGSEILEGTYRPDQRIGEQKVAERFNVSRGPVREALRILERRGLVVMLPRRGAFAIEHSLDFIADIFNTQASLSGMIARCYARSGTEESHALIEKQLSRMRDMCDVETCDPIAFAYASSRVQYILAKYCDNSYLFTTVYSGGFAALWDSLWRRRPRDFFTVERRRHAIEQWEEVFNAVRRRDEFDAERLTQQILFDSRDSALSSMARADLPSVSHSKRMVNYRR